MKFASWHDKNYRKLLIIPAILLVLSLAYLAYFYLETGDIINKDITLTGGSSFSIDTKTSIAEMTTYLSSENFNDFNVNSISDLSGNQIQLIITIGEGKENEMKSALENFLGYELTEENSSIESTSASLSQDFYKQLVVAVILAFFWMAAVVFVIFAKGIKIKIFAVIANLLFGIFMGNFFLSLRPIISLIIFLIFSTILIRTYIKYSVPAFAVMLSAFADIVMTLAVVNFLGFRLSTAGIVAFLMLIGYSVDTDILLTTRLLKKKEGINSAMYGALKTGMTMTITSIIAIVTALIIIYRFETVLNQIFTILLIGLGFDIFNTWVTNAGIIKWYMEKKE
jgi:preprotein translocase subunit SecF